MLARAWGIARSMVMYHGQPGQHRRCRPALRRVPRPWRPRLRHRRSRGQPGARLAAARRAGRRGRAAAGLPARAAAALRPRPPGDDRAEGGRREARDGPAGSVDRDADGVVDVAGLDRESVTADRSFARVRWDRSVEVEVTTLDELIAEHGVPAFCKIDVEGFEADVLGRAHPAAARAVVRVPAADPRRRPRRAGTGGGARCCSGRVRLQLLARRDHAVRRRPLARCRGAGPAARARPATRTLRRRLRPPRWVTRGSSGQTHFRGATAAAKQGGGSPGKAQPRSCTPGSGTPRS